MESKQGVDKERKKETHCRGVIDIGSNAIRLLIGQIENQEIKRLVKIREPIRLGADVFKKQEITQENIDKTVSAFQRFIPEFEKHGVEEVRIVATSAVREAKNKDQFVESLLAKTGLDVEIIDYKEESKVIFAAVCVSVPFQQDERVLLMDIGGGSVEFVIGENNQVLDMISLPLGTVRLLKNLEEDECLRDHLAQRIDEGFLQLEKLLQKYGPIHQFVGTGGNMDCLGDLRKSIFQKTSSSKIKYHELDFIIEELFMCNSKRRIQKFSLRSDRSDVILPASLLSQKVLVDNFILDPSILY